MNKQTLTFIGIQIASLSLSFFILSFALAGSHGHLTFSNLGGAVAMIITVLLIIPLFYLFAQRRKVAYYKHMLIPSAFIFSSAMAVLYLGVPKLNKRFVIEKNNINHILVHKDTALTITLRLRPEMFDRVALEAAIDKAPYTFIKTLNVIVYDDEQQIIANVFPPLSWDSLKSETMRMDHFFEVNEYTRMNRFMLSAQYSIEHTKSLKIQLTYQYSTGGAEVGQQKEFHVEIGNRFTMEKLINHSVR